MFLGCTCQPAMKFLQVYFIYSAFSKLMKFADCRLSIRSKNSCIKDRQIILRRQGHRVIKKIKNQPCPSRVRYPDIEMPPHTDNENPPVILGNT